MPVIGVALEQYALTVGAAMLLLITYGLRRALMRLENKRAEQPAD